MLLDGCAFCASHVLEQRSESSRHPLGVLAFELLTSCLYFPEYRFVFVIVHVQVWIFYGFDLLIYATYPVDVKMILAALAWKRMFGGFWQLKPETLQKQSLNAILNVLDGQPRNCSKCPPGMPSQEGLICFLPKPEIIQI